MVGPLEPDFRDRGAKMSDALRNKRWSPWITLSKTENLFLKSIEPLSSSCDLNMTQNEHVYAVCCPPEVDDDVIFSRNVKTFEGYVVVNFEVASSSSFWDIPKQEANQLVGQAKRHATKIRLKAVWDGTLDRFLELPWMPTGRLSSYLRGSKLTAWMPCKIR